MNKDFLKGINIGLGILTIFSIIGIVSAIGFHTTSEILPGTFTGDYIFNGNLQILSGTSGNSFEIETPAGNNPIIKFIDGDNLGSTNIYQLNSHTAISVDPTNVDTSSRLLFVIDGTERFRINEDGNVGIGTITPLEKLHVNGDIEIQRNATNMYCKMQVQGGECSAGWFAVGADNGYSLCIDCGTH